MDKELPSSSFRFTFYYRVMEVCVGMEYRHLCPHRSCGSRDMTSGSDMPKQENRHLSFDTQSSVLLYIELVKVVVVEGGLRDIFGFFLEPTVFTKKG